MTPASPKRLAFQGTFLMRIPTVKTSGNSMQKKSRGIHEVYETVENLWNEKLRVILFAD